MKKLFLFFAAMCLMLSTVIAQVSVWDGTHTTWTNGAGTQSDPYLIENAQHLAYLRNYVSLGNVTSGKYWKLTTNIDLDLLSWVPIGTSTYYSNTFKGHFDGNGKTIANLYINHTTTHDAYTQRVGLFAVVDGGSVKNIGIIGNGSVTGAGYQSSYTGAIIGYAANNATISNCYNICNVSAINTSTTGTSNHACVGGIIGYAENNVTISNCYNRGSVLGSIIPYNCSANAGGIVGYTINGVTISNCYNRGSISAYGSSSGGSYAAGIVGRGICTITNCYNTGNATHAIRATAGTTNPTNCYYLTGSGSGAFGGEARTAESLKSPDFVTLLNNGPAPNSAYAFDIEVINEGFAIHTWQAPPPVPPIITTTTLPDGSTSTAYSQQLAATGTVPMTWSLESGSLSNGLTLSATGLISGTPTVANTFNFTVKVTNSAGNDTQALAINIAITTTTTLPATSITKSTAILNGTIDFGNTPLTQQGFLLNRNGNIDTIYTNIQNNSISYHLSGLAPNTAYQYRVFAIANSNTYYGQYVTFTTLSFNQSGDAFLIETQEDLIALANLVNGGNSSNGQEFILANDIVLPENTPNNILSIGAKTTNRPFSGIFNGDNKRIFNVYIDHPNTEYQGFFGYAKDAHIKDLGLVNITASGRNYTGGMVGYAENTRLDYSYVSGGTLFALSYCGGLVGYQTEGTNSIITGCYNTCTVTGNHYVGGLLGYSYKGTVRNSYVAGLVTGQGNGVGAIIGGATETLMYNCYFNSDLTGQTIAIGENNFKGDEGDKTSEEMRMQEFVNTLNQGLVTPVWKMDYNPPINDGFPILIWQTGGNFIIEDKSINSLIKVYPNPTTGQLTIAGVKTDNYPSLQYSIYDITGRLLMAQIPNPMSQIQIDISHLSNGIYFVKIRTESGEVVSKVLKK